MDGASDQSYGINVASLAEIPLEITLRAKDILEKLESNVHYDEETFSKNNYNKPIIIDKTDPQIKEFINEVKLLDVDSMKPIDALLYLSSLKEKVNSHE